MNQAGQSACSSVAASASARRAASRSTRRMQRHAHVTRVRNSMRDQPRRRHPCSARSRMRRKSSSSASRSVASRTKGSPEAVRPLPRPRAPRHACAATAGAQGPPRRDRPDPAPPPRPRRGRQQGDRPLLAPWQTPRPQLAHVLELRLQSIKVPVAAEFAALTESLTTRLDEHRAQRLGMAARTRQSAHSHVPAARARTRGPLSSRRSAARHPPRRRPATCRPASSGDRARPSRRAPSRRPRAVQPPARSRREHTEPAEGSAAPAAPAGRGSSRARRAASLARRPCARCEQPVRTRKPLVEAHAARPATGTRAAASSMASGMPSRRRQISTDRGYVVGVERESRVRGLARARRTAAPRHAQASSACRLAAAATAASSAEDLSRRPRAAAPGWWRARAATPARASSACNQCAAASIRCSQLSSTSSGAAHRLGRVPVAAACSLSPHAARRAVLAVTAGPTRSGPTARPVSTNQAPSACRAAAACASRLASRSCRRRRVRPGRPRRCCAISISSSPVRLASHERGVGARQVGRGAGRRLFPYRRRGHRSVSGTSTAIAKR